MDSAGCRNPTNRNGRHGFYVYLINDVLIHGGGALDSTMNEAMTYRWLMADRIRFVFKPEVFLCLLRALSLPTSGNAARA